MGLGMRTSGFTISIHFNAAVMNMASHCQQPFKANVKPPGRGDLPLDSAEAGNSKNQTLHAVHLWSLPRSSRVFLQLHFKVVLLTHACMLFLMSRFPFHLNIKGCLLFCLSMLSLNSCCHCHLLLVCSVPSRHLVVDKHLRDYRNDKAYFFWEAYSDSLCTRLPWFLVGGHTATEVCYFSGLSSKTRSIIAVFC